MIIVKTNAFHYIAPKGNSNSLRIGISFKVTHIRYNPCHLIPKSEFKVKFYYVKLYNYLSVSDVI